MPRKLALSYGHLCADAYLDVLTRDTFAALSVVTPSSHATSSQVQSTWATTAAPPPRKLRGLP